MASDGVDLEALAEASAWLDAVPADAAGHLLFGRHGAPVSAVSRDARVLADRGWRGVEYGAARLRRAAAELGAPLPEMGLRGLHEMLGVAEALWLCPASGRSEEARSLHAIADLLGERGAARRIRGYAVMIDRAPAARRRAIVEAIAELEPALTRLAPGREALDASLPQYPVARALRARLVLGRRPVDLAPGLTRAEAHAWLCSGAEHSPGTWLAAQAGRYEPVHSIAVARWLIAVMRDPPRRAAMERPRREILAGQAIEGRYLDRVDELRDEDLHPSVEETYRRAAERLRARMEQTLRSTGAPLCAVPRWWRPARCARLLRTGPDLVREGRDLAHCVATYADAVRSGRAVIVGLCVLGQRSTVEIDPERLEVHQHCGRANKEPPALCVRAIDVLMRRWRRAAGRG
jgi:hypothetical protein